MLKLFTSALITIIALVIGWHIGFFLLGGVIAVSATIWSVIVASIIIFCFAILLAFLLTGIGVLVIGIMALILTVILIAVFPLLFPVLVPLLILLLVITYLRRREQCKQTNMPSGPDKI